MRQVFCVLLALVLTLGLVCMGFAEADKPTERAINKNRIRLMTII